METKPTLLSGCRILVTRPQPQNRVLCDLIEQYGGQAIPLPCIDIKALVPNQQTLNTIQSLPTANLVIFISVHAVKMAMPLIASQLHRHRQQLTIAAIGQKTAKTLGDYGIDVDIFPKQYDSEHLLNHPAFKCVNSQSVLIFRGQGGRTLLADTLLKRGARVQHAIVYERIQPDIDNHILLKAWETEHINVITLTSCEILHNFLELIGKQGQQRLHNSTLLVISQRIANAIQAKNIRSPVIVTHNSSNESILETLITWHNQDS